MRKLALLGLLLAGCVPASLFAPQRTEERNAVRDMAALRTREGACAKAWVGQSTAVTTCAITGLAHTTADSETPYLVTHLVSSTFPGADPGNWLITLTGPDGKELWRGAPEHSVAEVGGCSQYGCDHWSVAAVPIASAWAAGAYRIRYVCALDTRLSADMTIALTGRAVPFVRDAL